MKLAELLLWLRNCGEIDAAGTGDFTLLERLGDTKLVLEIEYSDDCNLVVAAGDFGASSKLK